MNDVALMEVFLAPLCVALSIFGIHEGLAALPNVVFILADDLDMELNGTVWLLVAGVRV